VVTDRVRPADAVHASLVTVGESKAAMLAIAWRDASGAEIDADERAITANGPAVHTFTRQPEGGWAPGRYEVEVRVDGKRYRLVTLAKPMRRATIGPLGLPSRDLKLTVVGWSQGKVVGRSTTANVLGLPRSAFVSRPITQTPALAQRRPVRIGILSPGQLTVDLNRAVLITELGRAGFVEGRNLEIIGRSSNGDLQRIPGLAASLVALQPDVIVAVSNPIALAIRAVSQTVPIVMSFAGSDPVADGLAASLARPGGSVTGIVMLSEELDVKRLELAHDRELAVW
jgi:hypothetical protein